MNALDVRCFGANKVADFRTAGVVQGFDSTALISATSLALALAGSADAVEKMIKALKTTVGMRFLVDAFIIRVVVGVTNRHVSGL